MAKLTTGANKVFHDVCIVEKKVQQAKDGNGTFKILVLGWMGGGTEVFIKGKTPAETNSLWESIPAPSAARYNVTFQEREYVANGKRGVNLDNPQFEVIAAAVASPVRQAA